MAGSHFDNPKLPRMVEVHSDGTMTEVDTSLKRMCEVAAGRLRASVVVLKMLYVDNDAAPEPLRTLFKDYIEQRKSTEEVAAELKKLAS